MSNTNKWEEYKTRNEQVARRFGMVSRKREIHILTKEDPVLANTLAQEMRDTVEELIVCQDELLGVIRDDPLEFIQFMRAVLVE